MWRPGRPLRVRLGEILSRQQSGVCLAGVCSSDGTLGVDDEGWPLGVCTWCIAAIAAVLLQQGILSPGLLSLALALAGGDPDVTFSTSRDSPSHSLEPPQSTLWADVRVGPCVEDLSVSTFWRWRWRGATRMNPRTVFWRWRWRWRWGGPDVQKASPSPSPLPLPLAAAAARERNFGRWESRFGVGRGRPGRGAVGVGVALAPAARAPSRWRWRWRREVQEEPYRTLSRRHQLAVSVGDSEQHETWAAAWVGRRDAVEVVRAVTVGRGVVGRSTTAVVKVNLQSMSTMCLEQKLSSRGFRLLVAATAARSTARGRRRRR